MTRDLSCRVPTVARASDCSAKRLTKTADRCPHRRAEISSTERKLSEAEGKGIHGDTKEQKGRIRAINAEKVCAYKWRIITPQLCVCRGDHTSNRISSPSWLNAQIAAPTGLSTAHTKTCDRREAPLLYPPVATPQSVSHFVYFTTLENAADWLDFQPFPPSNSIQFSTSMYVNTPSSAGKSIWILFCGASE